MHCKKWFKSKLSLSTEKDVSNVQNLTNLNILNNFCNDILLQCEDIRPYVICCLTGHIWTTDVPPIGQPLNHHKYEHLCV